MAPSRMPDGEVDGEVDGSVKVSVKVSAARNKATKCDRGTTKFQARILRGKGVQKKKRNKRNSCLTTSVFGGCFHIHSPYHISYVPWSSQELK